MADPLYLEKLSELQARFEDRYAQIAGDPAKEATLLSNYERIRSRIDVEMGASEEDRVQAIQAIPNLPDKVGQMGLYLADRFGKGLYESAAQLGAAGSKLWDTGAEIASQGINGSLTPAHEGTVAAKAAANPLTPQQKVANLAGLATSVMAPGVGMVAAPALQVLADVAGNVEQGLPEGNTFRRVGDVVEGVGTQVPGFIGPDMLLNRAPNAALNVGQKGWQKAFPGKVTYTADMANPQLQSALRLAEVEKRLPNNRTASEITASGGMTRGELDAANIIRERANDPSLLGQVFDTPASLGQRELMEARKLRDAAPEILNSGFFEGAQLDIKQLGVKDKSPMGAFAKSKVDDSLYSIEERATNAKNQAMEQRADVIKKLDEAQFAVNESGLKVLSGIKADDLKPYLTELESQIDGLNLTGITKDAAKDMEATVKGLKTDIEKLKNKTGSYEVGNGWNEIDAGEASIGDAQQIVSDIHRFRRKLKEFDENIAVAQANGIASAGADNGAKIQALDAVEDGLQSLIEKKIGDIQKAAAASPGIKGLDPEVLQYDPQIVRRANRAYENLSRFEDSAQKMTDITAAGGSRRSEINLKKEAIQGVTNGLVPDSAAALATQKAFLSNAAAEMIDRARGVNPEAVARNMAERERLRRVLETGRDMRDYIVVGERKVPFTIASEPRDYGFITTAKSKSEFLASFGQRVLVAGQSLAPSKTYIERSPAVNLGQLEGGLTLKALRDMNAIDDAQFTTGVTVEEVDPSALAQAQSTVIQMLQPLVEAQKVQDEQGYGRALSSIMKTAPELFAPSRSGLPGEIMLSKNLGKVYLPEDVAELSRRISLSKLSETEKARRLNALHSDGTVAY